MTEGGRVYRIAVLCSFNLDLVPRRVIRELGDLSVRAECYLAPYNQHYLVALDAASSLYAFEPDLVIFFVDVADILTDILASPLDFDAQQIDKRVDNAIAELQGAVTAVRRCLPNASILVHNFALTGSPSTGFLDLNGACPLERVVASLNGRLLELRAASDLTLIDYAGFVRRHGWEALGDPRLWYHGRMRLSPGGLDRLARLHAGYVFSLLGRTKKCLVCDLDNTLWGGIVGEVGAAGIELSNEGVGRAYKDLQRELLGLKARGILLALNSKNNWSDVAPVFAQHPEMVLRLDDFSAVRVNWTDKVTNLKEIAAELNLGLDSLVFVDDSPFECDFVRHELPEVVVVQLAGDPARYPELLRSLPWFQRLSLSGEDRARAEMMVQERRRQQAQAQAGSYEEFLGSLGMVAEFSALTETTVKRAAQLTQKTNQFNLTTRRYTEPELKTVAADGGHLPVLVRLRDRFGDSGIVGFALVQMDKAVWQIDTFLLSCRAMGRGLEAAMLSWIVRRAREQSVPRLAAHFIPTGRNEPAASFLPGHGFQRVDPRQWELDLTTSRLEPPGWIVVRDVPG